MQKVAGIQATNVNELVFEKNDQVVTSSRNVARDFEKEHRNVIRDIERVLKNEQAHKMFHKTAYIHPQNKQEYKEYLMNRDGFTLLVMGFTGERAMQFKISYMNAFNEMEERINKPRVLTDKEQRIEMLKLSLEHEQRFEDHDERLTHLEDTMRIDGREEQVIQSKAKGVIVESLGGKKSHAYKTMSRKVFASFWNEFKRYFEVPRYGDIPKKQFDAAVEWINGWQPDTSTRMQIRKENMQMSMEDDAS